MSPPRGWSEPPKRRRRSWLSIERVLLVFLAAGTWMRQDTSTRNAALIPPRSERNAEPRHAWHLVDGHSWQIVGPAVDIEPSSGDEQPSGACSPGMIEVAGKMKIERPGSEPIEELQNTTCTSWLQREFPERCAKFDEAQWLALAYSLLTTPMRFCMDRFEYPNARGQYPIIMVSWHEAQAACASNGKRLCTEAEWTFACEGEDAQPYPYGYERDANACDIDRDWLPYHELALRERSSPATMRELDSLWQGMPSGASPGCRSPFGVYDMTGNVDEWTVSTRREGLPSIFKGGYWGPVRARCRASTRVHDPDYVFYQQGFRCCSTLTDADAGSDSGDGSAE